MDILIIAMVPILISFAAFIGMLPLALYRAWVLTQLWLWFVVPVFGLPALDIRYAFGLSLIVNMFTQQPTQETKATEGFGAEFWGKIIGVYFGGLFGLTAALAVGWIIKSF